MDTSKHLSTQVAFLILLFHVPSTVLAKVTIESCTTANACEALIGYRLHDNLKVAAISQLFAIDTAEFLGANDFDLSLPDIENVVVPSGKLLIIPQSCGCINGIRQVNSTLYEVQAGDDLSKIAGYYGNLVTYEQIANANSILNANLIFVGQKLVIPLHCACHDGNDQGQPAYFLSYQVETGDTLTAIAHDYNTTVSDLQNINGLSSSSDVAAFDVIDVPIPACTSSFSQSALDYGLAVARGSYMITAGTCVQCSCTNRSTELYCARTPKSFSGACLNITCTNTNLTIGEFSTANSTTGCTVNSCLYNGYTNTTILTGLKTAVDPKCPVPLPPPLLYKPPAGLAASPLSEPEAGGSAPPPRVHSTPSAVTPSARGTVGHSSASVTRNWLPLTILLGLCFPVLIHCNGW